jgi:hypothetical protein
VVAAAAGTLAMDLLWYARYRHGGGNDRFADWELSTTTHDWEHAGAPAQMGRLIAKAVLRVDLPDEVAGLTNNIVHWATGGQWGALYGLVAGSAGANPLGVVVLGTAAWSASYAVLPLAKLYKPVWEYDLRTLAQDYSAHLVFGTVTGAAFWAFTRRGCRPSSS